MRLAIRSKETPRMVLNRFYLSKSHIYELEKAKAIRFHNLIVRSDEPCEEGFIDIDFSDIEQRKFEGYNYDLDILFEDESFLIINKPYGMLVHPDGNTSKTVANAVSYYYEKTNQSSGVYFPHRLDLETSGILIFCKNFVIESYIDHLFLNHEIERNYLAIVHGCVKSGKISEPIGSDRHENRMRVSKTGKTAITNYELIEQNGDRSLVKLRLETGRTHQIRVHMSYIKHPLFGDSLYGKKDFYRLALHSYHLKFIHPILGNTIEVTCPLPVDLEGLFKGKTA